MAETAVVQKREGSAIFLQLMVGRSEWRVKPGRKPGENMSAFNPTLAANDAARMGHPGTHSYGKLLRVAS